MIKVREALNIVLKNVKVLGFEKIKLIEALDRVIAENAYTDCNIPSFDNSAMDGYAVKSKDVFGAFKNNPKVLEVIADLKAGDVPKKILKNGQAIRIMTGAPLPKGADCVVMVEDTAKKSQIPNPKSQTNSNYQIPCLAGRQANSKKINKEYVEIYREVKAGENVREAGEDIKKGELVIKGGTLLNPALIGILASLGRAQIKVFRRPKVAILATGDELVDVDEKLEPGKIRSSNTYALYNQVIKSGGIPINLGIAKDSSKDLERKIKQALGYDVVITSGGVSVGDYDLVKDILAKLGTNIRFWKVAMKPGKPLAFGTIRNRLVFGLPGNPVSSMISFELFTRPAILKMSGQKQDNRKEVDAILEEDLEKKKGLMYFMRAKTHWNCNSYLTRTTGPQGSGILKSMGLANSLIILKEEDEVVRKGSKVTVRFLD